MVSLIAFVWFENDIFSYIVQYFENFSELISLILGVISPIGIFTRYINCIHHHLSVVFQAQMHIIHYYIIFVGDAKVWNP
jgi:polynucleotide 5'-kinase involved in rRNA processing